MAQNVYDDEDFFVAYAALERSRFGLGAMPEWPAMRAMLPLLGGARVVDLGCGYGWFCQWAAAAGARSVLGVDVSERMLERARSATAATDPITYARADLDVVELEPGSVDVAYSALALHYLTDIDRLFRVVADALVPGGRFVVSCEHPIFTAPRQPVFVTGPDGHEVWQLDQYLVEGERIRDWLAPGVRKHHRTLSTYVTTLLAAGFELTDLVEWTPTDDDLVTHPDWAAERERPMFLLLGATRRA